jgi:hypothetical protein
MNKKDESVHSVKIKEMCVHSQLVMTSSGYITNDIGGIDANYSLQSAANLIKRGYFVCFCLSRRVNSHYFCN